VPPLRFLTFDISDYILEKVAIKHGLRPEEVDEAFYNPDMRVRRTGFDVYRLFSQTEAGRYVLLIAANRGHGHWQIATAREMTQRERRFFQRG
jgi:hypothetical protein